MLLIQNGLLYTMEEENPVYADMLIKDGKIEKQKMQNAPKLGAFFHDFGRTLIPASSALSFDPCICFPDPAHPPSPERCRFRLRGRSGSACRLP